MRGLPEIGRATGGRATLLLALTTLAYLNSFHGVPQFDDYAVIIDEPKVATLAAWWQSLPGTRPLLKLSYALNRECGGLFGLHLLNLLVHLGNALLAWRLLLRLLPRERADAALLGALLFALHPVNTEAVTLLSGRSVSLSTLGMLASLLAALAGRRALSLSCFALAVGVRETALVLPLLLTLCHARMAWCESPGHSREVLRAALRATAAHWLLAALALLILLALPRYRELLAVSLATRAPLENLVTQAWATLYLLGQLLRPFALNADPRLPVFSGWDWGWALACSAWLLALVLSVWRIARGSFAAFAVLWFAIALLPTNSLIARLDVVSERQLYLASIPLGALLALAWDRAWLGSHRPGMTVPATLVGVLFAATVLRNRDYHTEAAFWASVLARDAGNARAWNNFGYALEREQPERFVEALAAYQQAIALDPSDYKPQHNRLLLCSRHADAPGCASRGL